MSSSDATVIPTEEIVTTPVAAEVAVANDTPAVEAAPAAATAAVVTGDDNDTAAVAAPTTTTETTTPATSNLSYSAKRQRVECDDDKIGMHVTILAQALSAQGIDVPNRFKASTKDLYSDFVVREIPSDSNGQPLRLTSLGVSNNNTPTDTKSIIEAKQQARAAKKELKEKEAAEEDAILNNPEVYGKLQEEVIAAFTPIIGEGRAKNMATAVTTGNEEKFIIGAIAEKSHRGQFHSEVKRLIGTRYLSSTDNGQVVISRATNQMKRDQERRSNAGKVSLLPPGAAGTAAAGGTADATAAAPAVAEQPRPNNKNRFIHFTVYKENTDNAAALRFIANQCSISSRQLQFSGTKDKRAVTLQRVACKGLDYSRLEKINRMSVSRNGIVRIGDYTEKDTGLCLGDANGNHFAIALRIVDEESAAALKAGQYPLELIQKTLSENGFVNYFGPQRFGTTSILTSDMGRLLLKGEYKEAIAAILESRCEISPEARRMHTAFTTLPSPDCYETALAAAPMYCFAERDLLKYLASHPGDFKGALTAMHRTSVMMYFHAVQSWYWNEWVSRRLSKGVKVMVGDMVVAEGSKLEGEAEEGHDESSAEAATTKPAAAAGNNNQHLPKIHYVTAEDIAQNKYTIFDVLMTVPGCDPALQYPENEGLMTKEKLKGEILAQGLATLFDETHEMARQYHFFGTYRKMVIALSDLKLYTKTYSHPSEVLIPTDLQLIKVRENGGAEVEANKMAVAPQTAAHQGVAVIAEFSLPAGAYATCVLREFCETVRGAN